MLKSLGAYKFKILKFEVGVDKYEVRVEFRTIKPYLMGLAKGSNSISEPLRKPNIEKFNKKPELEVQERIDTLSQSFNLSAL